jgi:hypothetical protein
MAVLEQLQPTMESLGAWLLRQRPSHTVRALVLHHTWSPTAAQYHGRSTLEGIRRYHMEQRGWSEIGANLYATPDMTVWTARPLESSNWAHAVISRAGVETEASAISGGDSLWFNHHALGLETIANFDTESLTQGSSAVSLVCALRVMAVVLQTYNLRPERIFFHRDVADKSCPGSQLTRWRIREEVVRYMDSSPQVDVDTWAQEAVEWVKSNGVMRPGPDGKFRGRDPMTRQEVAVAL